MSRARLLINHTKISRLIIFCIIEAAAAAANPRQGPGDAMELDAAACEYTGTQQGRRDGSDTAQAVSSAASIQSGPATTKKKRRIGILSCLSDPRSNAAPAGHGGGDDIEGASNYEATELDSVGKMPANLEPLLAPSSGNSAQALEVREFAPVKQIRKKKVGNGVDGMFYFVES